ncbi:Ig-like domain-containing protein [Rhodococcus sp. NPDC058532]|uniref:Ig-like domain-containing protein n=1 Tax=Rhodococcus sp. NPDC058532 TaxID=3346540 RepID=UPI0036645A9D
MFRPMMRRGAAALGVAALATLGLGIGGGTASAATTATETVDNVKVTKSVTPGAVDRGATVTYRSVLEVTGGADRYLTKFTDVHPAGFEYVPGSAKLTSSTLTAGPSTTTITPAVDAAKNTVTVSGSWLLADRLVAKNKDVIVELTYRVPATAVVGVVDSGLAFDIGGWNSSQVFNPIGVRVDVNAPDVATATVLTAPAAATVGGAVTLAATVNPAPSGGTVQFADNGTPIGAPVPVSSGTAQLPHTFDTAGAHAITAIYSGAAEFVGSEAAAVTVRVTSAPVGGGDGDSGGEDGGTGSAGSGSLASLVPFGS